MPLYFVRDDITRMETDAIVLPANPKLEPGPGASEAIYVAAGQERLEGELRLQYPDGCDIGKAVITNGYELPAKKIIHAVCPQWLDGMQGEQGFLYSAYMESLKLAGKNKCGSIAFPLLSAGSYEYPRIDAIKVAVNAIMDYLTEYEMNVFLVFFTEEAVRDGYRLFGSIESRITDDGIFAASSRRMKPRQLQGKFGQDDWYDQKDAFKAMQDAPDPTEELSVIMKAERESFRDMLFRLIEERRMTEPQVYHAAHLTRQHFGKIKQNEGYRPKKKAVLALAFALHLNTADAEELLAKAGYALSDSEDFDLVMKYCLDRRHFDLNDIDQFLEFYELGDETFKKRKKPSRGKTE